MGTQHALAQALLEAQAAYDSAIEAKLLAEIASGNSSGSRDAAIDDGLQIGVLFDALLKFFQFLVDAGKIRFTTRVVVEGLEATIEVVNDGDEIVKRGQDLNLILRENGDPCTKRFYGVTECTAGFRLFTARLSESVNTSIEPFDMGLEVGNLGFRALGRVVRLNSHSSSSSVGGCANSPSAGASSSASAESTEGDAH